MFAMPLLTAVLLSVPVSAAQGSAPATSDAPVTVPAETGFPRFPMPRFRMPGRSKRSVVNAPLALVDRRLRLLVTQQERWFSENARYGSDVPRVARLDAVSDTSLHGVQVQVLYASSKGWTAIASHPEAPGKSCVVFVGQRERLPFIPRTRADAAVADDEGRPACDNGATK